MLHAQVSRGAEAFSHAYGVCCYLAMVNLAALTQTTGREIFYTFEKGHPHEAKARELVKAISMNPALKQDFRHAGDAFVKKGCALPLEAADLLAWEWAKFHDETLIEELRPLRRSLKALWMRDTKRYSIAHVKGDKLAQWLDVMPGLLRQEGVIDEAGRTKVVH